jgi:RNA polymerase sigma-B factor
VALTSKKDSIDVVARRSATCAHAPDSAADRPRLVGLLLRRCRRGDATARTELVESYLPLARKLACKYARAGESLDDLYQVACIGLVKAVDRYDAERGVAFSSFAVPTIIGELKLYCRATRWAVHVPRGLQERILQVNWAMLKLTRELGRAPTTGELAGELAATVEEVIEAMEAAAALDVLSLDTPVSAREHAAATYAESVGADDPAYDRVEWIGMLTASLNQLPHRDRLILQLRFEEDLTQSAIAERLGISQMHVSRLIRRALARMRMLAEAA